ncbi:urease accessory protein UreD [Serratia fonticola]|uniref:urease accessory protein UreD n=1 Tax=Serratia fonticola TaxID=47917 RepID=UPI003CC92139
MADKKMDIQQSDVTSADLDALSLGANAPELAAFQNEPAQMRSGAVGKYGYLRLKFSQRGNKSVLSDMERRVPLLVQKALYWDEEMPFLPCVSIVSTSGCVLQGDRLAINIDVDEGASAFVTTPSATKIHMMDSNFAAQTQHIRVAEKGYLEYIPDPIIPHRHSRFISDTLIECQDGGSVIYSEILMSGRKYHHEDEHFGFDVYSSRIRMKNSQGEVCFTEKMVIEPHKTPVNSVGVMAHYSVYGNVIVITDKTSQDEILSLSPSYFSHELCHGVSRLPGNVGLIFKVLAEDGTKVKQTIRTFWGISRKAITGHTLPEQFLWKK